MLIKYGVICMVRWNSTISTVIMLILADNTKQELCSDNLLHAHTFIVMNYIFTYTYTFMPNNGVHKLCDE